MPKKRAKRDDDETSVVKKLASGPWWDIERKTDKSTTLTEDALRLVYEEQVTQFEATLEHDSEQRWLKKVGQSGTAADQVAAHKVTAEMCPPLSLRPLKRLIAMASRKGRSEAILGIETLQTLFLELLPRRRKLAALDLRNSPPASDCVVSQVLSYFEDALKLMFAGFVDLLVQGCNDNVEFMKIKCVKNLGTLLTVVPEQEACIRQALVNKLGDKSKTASTVSHALLEVVEKRPAMKGDMIRDITELLRRDNVSLKAKYMCTVFLSEIRWNRNKATDQAACRELCSMLADFLDQMFLTKKGKTKAIREEDNRLIRSCVTGMNRALGACGSEYVVPTSLIDCLFRVCHTVPAFATRIAILCLLYRVVSRGQQIHESSDRFFRLLYTQLMCVDLFHAKNENMVFHLVRKVLVEDHVHIRCMAVARRLLQLCALQGEPGAAFGSLWAFSDFMLAKKTELRRVWKAASDNALMDEEEEYIDDGAKVNAEEKKTNGYDPSAACRDPKFARPHEARMWELWALKSHLHPQVQTSAKKLMEMNTFTFSDDPFDKWGVGKFLDFMNLVNQNCSKSKEYHDTKKRVAPEEEFHAQYFRDSKIMSKRQKVDRKMNIDEVTIDDGKTTAEGDADAFFQKYLEGQAPNDDMDDMDDMDDSDAGSEGSDAGSDGSDAASQGPDGSFDGESFEDSASVASGKGEARLDLSEFHSLPLKEKRKRQKQIFRKFTSFASAEDFEHLLSED